MIQPIVRLEVYKKQNSDVDLTKIYYNNTPDYVLPLDAGFVNLQTTHSIEKRKDKISFTIFNHREFDNTGNAFYTLVNDISFLEEKDLIKVYAWNKGDFSGNFEDLNDLQKKNYHIMTAYVKSYNYNSSETVGTFSVTCFNRTEVLLNSFMFVPYNEGERVPVMIVDSINKIKNYNRNDTVTAFLDYNPNGTPGTKGAYNADGQRVYYELDGDGNKIYNTNGVGIPETGYIRAYKKDAYKNDGSGELKDVYLSSVPSNLQFPKVTFVETYKPFVEHLLDLSTSKYTEDNNAGTYINWVDENNNLHWGPKEFETNDVEIKEETVSSLTYNKDIDNVVNAVIVNAGEDPSHSGILALAFNSTSMGLNGARWAYKNKTDIADEIYRLERNSGDHVDDEGNTIPGTDNAGNEIGEDSYPSSYPWVVQTSESDKYGSWSYIAGTTEVNSNRDYRQYIRRVVKRLGEKKGEDIVKYNGEGKVKSSFELEYGTNNYSIGQMLTIYIPSLNVTKVMRVMAINHVFNNAWVTTLELEEDIDKKLITGE